MIVAAAAVVVVVVIIMLIASTPHKDRAAIFGVVRKHACVRAHASSLLLFMTR